MLNQVCAHTFIREIPFCVCRFVKPSPLAGKGKINHPRYSEKSIPSTPRGEKEERKRRERGEREKKIKEEWGQEREREREREREKRKERKNRMTL